MTAAPGGAHASGAGSPITVTGLTDGTSYTFTVTATNSAGTSQASAPSAAVTPSSPSPPSPPPPAATPPGAPTGVAALSGDAQATVYFTAPASNGGASITSYRITASPGGATATGPASPITVAGLANGATYTFTVAASNSAGTGPESVASNAVTPSAPVQPLPTPAPTTPTNPPPNIVVDESVGGVSIGMSEAAVVALLGPPSSTLTLSLGNGKTGLFAHYHEHGGDFLVTYDSSGHVISIEVYSSFYRTSAGVGPGSALTDAARLRGFRADFCQYGYWNGNADKFLTQ